MQKLFPHGGRDVDVGAKALVLSGNSMRLKLAQVGNLDSVEGAVSSSTCPFALGLRGPWTRRRASITRIPLHPFLVAYFSRSFDFIFFMFVPFY